MALWRSRNTPDHIFNGVAQFVHTMFKKHHVHSTDLICDVAAGTGALARNLVKLGYSNITAFDKSREMLSEAFRLSAHLPSIKPVEADIASLRLPPLLRPWPGLISVLTSP